MYVINIPHDHPLSDADHLLPNEQISNVYPGTQLEKKEATNVEDTLTSDETPKSDAISTHDANDIHVSGEELNLHERVVESFLQKSQHEIDLISIAWILLNEILFKQNLLTLVFHVDPDFSFFFLLVLFAPRDLLLGFSVS